jgi:microcystin-dependent protein
MASDNMPIGTIIIWAGDPGDLPPSWKVCNGKQLKKTDYAELYGTLGTRWDNDNGYQADFFSLPDLRGVFLRGVNDDRVDGYQDLDVDSRVRLKGNSAVSMDDAGSYQRCDVQSHLHALKGVITTGVANGAAGPDGNSYHGWGTIPATENSGGRETRPVNAYVYFVIKVKN